MIACSQKQKKRNTFAQRMPQWQKLDSKASERNESESAQTEKGAKIKLKVLFIFLVSRRRSSKPNLKQSKTDHSQLFTIACSHEHEKRNKIMAQAGAPKLTLSRSKGKKCKHHTLSWF